MTQPDESDAPRCDCSLGLRFKKGNGPDPARCPVHGEPASATPPASTAQPTEENPK